MRFKQKHPQPIRKKYRLYSPSSLINAFKAVKDDGMSVLRASRTYKVPENTLRDRVLGKVDPETVVMGKVPLFDEFEEAQIVNHFKAMADLGYGYTQQECIDVASQFAVQLGKRTVDTPLSMMWMKGFLKRWPEMRVVKPRTLDHVRAKMASEKMVSNFFESYQKCLQKHDLQDKRHLLYNIDEKGVSIDHKPPYIVASSNYPAQAVTSGKGKTVTIIGAGSASGTAVPPFFVFPGKRMNSDLWKGASPGASGTMSESGWSNTQVFIKYLTKHFIQFMPGRCESKILLLLDGHRSHVSLILAEWAKENGIILYVLLAHTSHLLQPLDVACYGPFQRIYHSRCHKIIRETSAAITQYNVCDIVCHVYHKALSAENLQVGFRKTGLFPLNKDAIPRESMFPAQVYHSDDTDDSDLKISVTN
ncbi:uncharacterized protein LOC127863270 [Dreissena polymorpha]|uniref:uncharacterized protein LOC127863270 n=1 Tax=Dreissena polymorpha TaxID=45954 RepID=UPI002264B180|nr:uncharacterized protein LOC127863270 [Dreissena polymorpha]